MKNVNRPCCEMLKENCVSCDNAVEIDGDWCHTLRGYQQGKQEGKLYAVQKMKEYLSGVFCKYLSEDCLLKSFVEECLDEIIEEDN